MTKLTTEQIEHFKEQLQEENPLANVLEGLDGAIVGLVAQGPNPALLLYSTRAMIEIIVARDGMSEEEADEFVEFNITGGWLGPGTPFFLRDA